jgi:hypothetical protein
MENRYTGVFESVGEMTFWAIASRLVSGTVALMIEGAKATFGVKPSPNAIKAMLQTSAFPMSDASGAQYNVLTQGAGTVNPLGAIALAKAIDSTRSVGSNWLVTSVTESTTIDGQNVVWGDNIVWGDNVVWGEILGGIF